MTFLSELDIHNRQALLALLTKQGQVFLSLTDVVEAEREIQAGAQVIRVADLNT